MQNAELFFKFHLVFLFEIGSHIYLLHGKENAIIINNKVKT